MRAQDKAETTDSLPQTELTADQVEYFEKHIRPVLTTKCEQCHSATADPLHGNLFVDSQAGLIEGGDSGPAIVPGKPDESLLMESIRYESFEMPPDEQLSDEVIQHFETWIEMGAPDPRTADSNKPVRRQIDFESGRDHWAYRPIQPSTPPEVAQNEWAAHPIDRFIFSEINKLDLQPAPIADRETLIRRLSFDLTGLPPTPEQIQAFVADESPQAYERLVDQLMASPHFGEHWGRHWLDLVRYAESITLRGFILPEAWRYRDYVIDSYNKDRPFDQFLTQQLAGDLVPATSIPEQRDNLIATGFLTLGNTNLEQQDKQQLEMDYVDEQLDVIGKALLAQTITCARCHDHKFDPIPTSDYYALAGIFANIEALEHENVSKWVEQPLPLDPQKDASLIEAKKQRKKLTSSIQSIEAEIENLESKAADRAGPTFDNVVAKLEGNWVSSSYVKPYTGDGYIHDDNQKNGELRAVFELTVPESGRYEVRYSYTASENRATNVPVVIVDAEGPHAVKINQRNRPTIREQFTSLGEFHFEADGPASVSISNLDTDGHVIVDSIQLVHIGESEMTAEEIQARARLKELKSELDSSKKEIEKLDRSLKAIPKAMGVRESKQIKDIPIHIRGDVHRLGDVVPRGTLQVIDVVQSGQMPSDQSGRLELAQWITASDNPLTSRVYANRVWLWLMGEGLVKTVDNFGTTGQSPTHPELLDYLANQLVNSNWSTKTLVREIVLSRTYQLASIKSEQATELDPSNKWYSHARSKRVSAESMRDAMLLASGEIDLSIGGATFSPSMKQDYDYNYDGMRRGVYVPVFRNSLPELYQVFDFPNPSLVIGKRPESTSAPQALWMMNHPFVLTRSQKVAERLMQLEITDNHELVQHAYQLCLGRTPSPAEADLAVEFIGTSATQPNDLSKDALAEFIQVLFASPEFRYYR